MKRTTRVKCAALAAVGTTLLAACGTESGTGSDTITDRERTTGATGIADVEWLPRQVTVDGKEYDLPNSARNAHITFAPGTADPDVDGGRSGGSVGCNSFGADAEIDGDTVKITDLVSTTMGCVGPVGEFESKFISVFDNTLKAAVEDRDGTRTLTLTSRAGDSITLRAGDEKTPPLHGTRWSLGDNAYLTLTRNNTVTGSLGCNTFNGKATVKDGAIEFGRLATTRMMCSGPVMKAERELAEILSGKVSYQQERDSLKITKPSGESVTARAE